MSSPPRRRSRERGRLTSPLAAAALRQNLLPPTAERCAQVQLMRTLGIVGMDQEITEVEMKAFVDVFAMPVSFPILTAIAALLGHTLPDELLRADPTVV
jgi:succinylarginine dihydrolase